MCLCSFSPARLEYASRALNAGRTAVMLDFSCSLNSLQPLSTLYKKTVRLDFSSPHRCAPTKLISAVQVVLYIYTHLLFFFSSSVLLPPGVCHRSCIFADTTVRRGISVICGCAFLLARVRIVAALTVSRLPKSAFSINRRTRLHVKNNKNF